MKELIYIIASVLFILGLKRLGSASTARQGNLMSATGMGLAVIATLAGSGFAWGWIALGIAIGSTIGAVAAKKVPMTGMPEMVALFNGSGGIASLFVGWASQVNPPGGSLTVAEAIPLYLAVLIGGVTFTGSLVAYLKLSEKIDGKPIQFKGQQIINIALLGALLVFGILFSLNFSGLWIILAVVLSFTFGVMVVIPIGGADMPVVIALLNSYSGLAACAAGFIISNTVLIVAGALVGASGLILTGIMCKAMNRSLSNVLFSGFGSAVAGGSGKDVQGEANPISAEDTYYILEAASSVIFVPGYGMAVAQAQHAVKELGALLEKNGCEVQFAIHPVAGRMPGHMNVLLAEADVPYEQLVEPEDVNPNMPAADVAIVIGANDVVNPAARTDETSPLWGMPIINVDLAKTCIVLKRSLRPGYAGVENPLFFCENTRMLLGDAKASVQALVAAFKED
ncbi:MAG: NAD(P)(+) transhydrogenase (Re/Si-specific) subunit beta [Verrucomicrobia bacterium]|nr:NAD(P)(+) transhydrogenase (Re/Si-specific) subunit beta [Verrucomicrobiota bacterium]MCH8513198.1 NAD(P)(+) transhydrogenase (Re/Si-specific) subunit beta [Kiritimatiellia bacterium]